MTPLLPLLRVLQNPMLNNNNVHIKDLRKSKEESIIATSVSVSVSHNEPCLVDSLSLVSWSSWALWFLQSFPCPFCKLPWLCLVFDCESLYLLPSLLKDDPLIRIGLDMSIAKEQTIIRNNFVSIIFYSTKGLCPIQVAVPGRDVPGQSLLKWPPVRPAIDWPLQQNIWHHCPHMSCRQDIFISQRFCDFVDVNFII